MQIIRVLRLPGRMAPASVVMSLYLSLPIILVGCVPGIDLGRLNRQLEGKEPLSRYRIDAINELPIPKGSALPVEPRQRPYNLTLGVGDVVGEYARRYRIDAGGFGGIGPGRALSFVDSLLTKELANYLRHSNLFKEVTQEPRPEPDLILTLELNRFEVRKTNISEFYMLERRVGDAETITTVTAEGEIDGRFIIKGYDDSTFLEVPVTLHSGPTQTITRERLNDINPPQAVEPDMRPSPHEAIVEQMFARLYQALVAKDEELAKLAGPPIPAVAAGRTLTQLGPIGNRWAVIIGVARYEHAAGDFRSLQYADRDAKELAALLLSPVGGGFGPENVRLLTNRDATCRNVRAALFEFLQSADEADLALIYFSGHGVPDPRRPESLYLMCYDSDPAHIASTALPMRELQAALQNNIEAQRVVVLADSCHSAGITEAGIRAVGVENAVNQSFAQLWKTRPGRVIFTSSEGYELSREGHQWGGGHGVFTWALLEAMRGKADGYDGTPPDGVVTLGELIEYTRDAVRRDTDNAQHPAVAGIFDRTLPIAWVARQP
jgi:uncharacterized caspase-like protein